MDIKSIKKAYTLENLIEGLDERGLLVLQVLIGQRAMGLLAKDTSVPSTIVPKNILIPNNPVNTSSTN